jgi:hypothetical protein
MLDEERWGWGGESSFQFVLSGRFLYEWVLLRERHLRAWSPRVFLNLRRTQKYRKLHARKLLSFKTQEPRKIGGFPRHRTLGFFSSPGGDPSKYTEIKRQSFVDCSGCLNVVLCEILREILRTMMSLA